jgi:SGNH hydrolase-like domain, acetyltransferase AlgX
LKRWLQLSFLCPAVMVAAATMNPALSFKGVDWLAFRTWEAAVSVECPSGVGPFEPGKVYRKQRAYGDLANIGNMADMRQYRREEFTVDLLGFRNPRSVQNERPAGFVLGDSFTAGAGISDDDTLPQQLTAEAGKFFYNAGTVTGDLAKAEVVSSTLNLTQGTVVYELLERSARNGPSSTEAAKHPCEAGSFWNTSGVGRAATLFASSHSPALLLSRKLVKRIENDFWLPNPYGRDVVRRRLQNGQEILFYPDDFKPVSRGRIAMEWSAYFADLQRGMAARNLKPVVLRVPNKCTVYGQLLDEKVEDLGGDRLLSAIEAELRKQKVPAINLTQTLQASAARALARDEYVFWRDDTHWNPLGIKLAAEALWAEVRRMPANAAANSQ